MSVLRYAEANNSLMKTYNKKQPSSHILYLDCNNLYGKAMLEYLPVGNFQWEKNINIQDILFCPPDADVGYLVECDLHYPSKLHNLHSDYPLAPHHASVNKQCLSPFALALAQKNNVKGIGRTSKLLCTLFDKESYVLHYRVLQLYISLGLKLKKIRKVLSFSQQPILKSYINFNTQKRAESTNDFDNNYFKLMSNSLFGKTMERPENRTKVSLVKTIKDYEKKVADLNFKSAARINKNLVSIQMRYAILKIKKPIYLGMCILDLSKFFMYDFHYNVMLNYFSPTALSLLYTDTDSFIYHIKSENIYEDLVKLKEYFDFSNYPPDHFLFCEDRKKIPGFFKDESGGKIITKFISLKSKMYSFITEENEQERRSFKLKGVHYSIINNDIKFENFLDCLNNHTIYEHEFNNIRSFQHKLFTSKQSKISLSAYDDKRYLLNNISSVPYGHVNYS